MSGNTRPPQGAPYISDAPVPTPEMTPERLRQECALRLFVELAFSDFKRGDSFERDAFMAWKVARTFVEFQNEATEPPRRAKGD